MAKQRGCLRMRTLRVWLTVVAVAAASMGCRSVAVHVPSDSFELRLLPFPAGWEELYRGPYRLYGWDTVGVVSSWKQFWGVSGEHNGFSFGVIEYRSRAAAWWALRRFRSDPANRFAMGCAMKELPLWRRFGFADNHRVVCSIPGSCSSLCYSMGRHRNYVLRGWMKLEPEEGLALEEAAHYFRTIETHVAGAVEREPGADGG